MTYNLLSINYDAFGEAQIRELSKIIEAKYGQKAVTILEFLKNKPRDQLVIKKDLRKLFDESPATIDKVIDSLEVALAISGRSISTSYYYEITSIGLKMLDMLKGEDDK